MYTLRLLIESTITDNETSIDAERVRTKTTRITSASPKQTQQASELFEIMAVDKTCSAKFSLFECFQNITHAAERRKNASFPHVSNQWGDQKTKNVKGSQPLGKEIILLLLLGIWCINTTLEKH